MINYCNFDYHYKNYQFLYQPALMWWRKNDMAALGQIELQDVSALADFMIIAMTEFY